MRLFMTIGLLILGMGLNAQIYYADNGLTIKASTDTKSGDKGELDGITYTIVDNATLGEMVENGDDVSKVVTTLVTNMKSLFSGKTNFNLDISKWDVSNVTDISFMFKDASAFNQDISNWDISNVRWLHGTFRGASSFNQNLGSWNVSNVINMDNMFYGASSFNQDISNWNVSKVSTMIGVFLQAHSFNQNINSWDVDKVEHCYNFLNGSALNNSNIPKFTKCNLLCPTNP